MNLREIKKQSLKKLDELRRQFNYPQKKTRFIRFLKQSRINLEHYTRVSKTNTRHFLEYCLARSKRLYARTQKNTLVFTGIILTLSKRAIGQTKQASARAYEKLNTLTKILGKSLSIANKKTKRFFVLLYYKLKSTYKKLSKYVEHVASIIGKYIRITYKKSRRSFLTSSYKLKLYLRRFYAKLKKLLRETRQYFIKFYQWFLRKSVEIKNNSALLSKYLWGQSKILAVKTKNITIKDLKYTKTFLIRAAGLTKNGLIFLYHKTIIFIKKAGLASLYLTKKTYAGLVFVFLAFAIFFETIWQGIAYASKKLWSGLVFLFWLIVRFVKAAGRTLKYISIKTWLGLVYVFWKIIHLLKTAGHLLLATLIIIKRSIVYLSIALYEYFKWLSLQLFRFSSWLIKWLGKSSLTLVVATYKGFIASLQLAYAGLKRTFVFIARSLNWIYRFFIRIVRAIFRYIRLTLRLIDWAIESLLMVIVYVVRHMLIYLWLTIVFVFKSPKLLAIKIGQHFDRLKQYALLIRLDKPIGITLLLWPTLIALWIAAEGIPDPFVLFVFVAGTFLMRSAGCAINDYADRDIDKKVLRTKDRPLTSGKISGKEAIAIFIVLGLCAFSLVLYMNELTIALSFVGVFLAVTYPFMKRYHYLPQVHLGAAFGWAVPMAYAAQTGEINFIAALLFITTLLWTTAYDTMYAMVDYDYDVRIGVKSTAILFGDLDRHIIGVIQMLVIFSLILIGHKMELTGIYFTGVFAATFTFIYQQFLIHEREPDDCFKAFLNNNWFGMILFIAVFCEYTFAGISLN